METKMFWNLRESGKVWSMIFVIFFVDILLRNVNPVHSHVVLLLQQEGLFYIFMLISFDFSNNFCVL